MISKENQMMLSILGNALHGMKSEPAENWSVIIREMKAQTVFAIPASNISPEKIEQAEMINYMQLVGKNVRTFHKLMSEQRELLNVLENAGIPSVILKGASAAMNYPEPEFRCMGDIDIIVKPDDFEKAYQIMCGSGYKTNNNLENYHRHIGFQSQKGIHIELHNYFSTSDNKKQNEFLDSRIYNGIDKREIRELNGYRISVLPKLENGLVLLAHINQHIGTGLGLRQIIDWMCYAEKHLTDDLWNNSFAEAAEKIGMKKLALAVTAMCRKYLRLDSGITWCSDADETLCDELMEYIINHGNFGNKSENNPIAVRIVRISHNPIKILKQAQKSGLVNWKATDKYWILRPFAWIYQLCRWARRGKQKGINIKSTIHQEQRESKLLKKLGVTRM